MRVVWLAALEFACLQLRISQGLERQLTEHWSGRQLEEWTLSLALCLRARAVSCYGV